MRRKFDSMLADLGFHKKSHQRGVYLHEGMNIAATAHQAGTARFGADPGTSVLDVNCKAHQARQPLRRGLQLLRLDRRGESDADHHRQRPAGRRST